VTLKAAPGTRIFGNGVVLSTTSGPATPVPSRPASAPGRGRAYRQQRPVNRAV